MSVSDGRNHPGNPQAPSWLSESGSACQTPDDLRRSGYKDHTVHFAKRSWQPPLFLESRKETPGLQENFIARRAKNCLLEGNQEPGWSSHVLEIPRNVTKC